MFHFDTEDRVLEVTVAAFLISYHLPMHFVSSAIIGGVFLAGLLIGLVIVVVACRVVKKSRGFTRLSKYDEFSSQSPIYKQASNSKCDIADV